MAIESMKGLLDCDGGEARRNQLTIIQAQQSSMIDANQKDQKPPPGPSSGTQPISSSALFHMR